MLGVNAFNQPAVEEGKILARQYMSQMPSRG
jgi:glucose-6-phosphate isomerase